VCFTFQAGLSKDALAIFSLATETDFHDASPYFFAVVGGPLLSSDDR
jgi:hypothetical protein